MSEPISFEVKALAPALVGDYLAFFDHDAFRDNPEWSACYCYFPHASREPEPPEGQEHARNRAAVAAMIERGAMHGYLAYDGGRPIAWCNTNLRASYTILPAAEDAERSGAIVCFVVAAPYRGKGVARRLLDVACAGLREQGIASVDAFPLKEADSAAANFHGPLSMYLAAGFARVGEHGPNLVLRKALIDSAPNAGSARGAS